MLTFQEYIALCEDEQIQLLSLDGVYLDLIRICRSRSVELYALYNFYVEIFFEQETGEPLFIKPFDNLEALDPYLEVLDITGLLGIREEGM
jgi:hypothetical protein